MLLLIQQVSKLKKSKHSRRASLTKEKAAICTLEAA